MEHSRLQTADHGPETTVHRPQIIAYRSQTDDGITKRRSNGENIIKMTATKIDNNKNKMKRATDAKWTIRWRRVDD